MNHRNILTSPTRRKALAAAVSFPFAAAVPRAFAQGANAPAYPNKPVRIIVPFGPGGAADTLPRIIGERMTAQWGQPVVIENKAGAAGNIGMTFGARSAPDGYTLTSAPVGNLAINPHLYPNLGFDVRKDLSLITLIASVENVLVVNADTGIKTLPELLARAKANPGKITFASGGIGTQAHIGGELLNVDAGVQMLHVSYKGVGDAVRDVMAGLVTAMVAQVPSVLPHIQSGKLRALGIASSKPSDLLPGVPTIEAAANLPGFEALSWYALVGPAGIPGPIVEKIQHEVVVALRSPGMSERLQGMGMKPVGSTPQELAAVLNADYTRYGTIIQKRGIAAN